MNTARESAVRLLKLMMVASLVLPALLYAYASWVSYRDTHAAADERIERSLDVQQEQALRVFQTIDRTFAEVDEVVRGMSDEQIRAAQSALHPRLDRISGVMPELQAIVLIDRNGVPMASSALPSVKTDGNFADRDYFKVQVQKDAVVLGGRRVLRQRPLAGDIGAERVEALHEADVAVPLEFQAGGDGQVSPAALAGNDETSGVDLESRCVGHHPVESRHAVVQPGRERGHLGHR